MFSPRHVPWRVTYHMIRIKCYSDTNVVLNQSFVILFLIVKSILQRYILVVGSQNARRINSLRRLIPQPIHMFICSPCQHLAFRYSSRRYGSPLVYAMTRNPPSVSEISSLQSWAFQLHFTFPGDGRLSQLLDIWTPTRWACRYSHPFNRPQTRMRIEVCLPDSPAEHT